MNKNISLKSKTTETKPIKQKVDIEDVIFLLISIFTDNDIKTKVYGENSLAINIDNQLFEIVVNKINK